MPRVIPTFTAVSLLALSGCAGKTDPADKSDPAAYQELVRLPTGAQLDPAGRSVEIGDFPITEILSPDRSRLILLLGAYRQQGVQVVDRRSGALTQTLLQPAAFVGLAFSPDGKKLCLRRVHRQGLRLLVAG